MKSAGSQDTPKLQSDPPGTSEAPHDERFQANTIALEGLYGEAEILGKDRVSSGAASASGSDNLNIMSTHQVIRVLRCVSMIWLDRQGGRVSLCCRIQVRRAHA